MFPLSERNIYLEKAKLGFKVPKRQVPYRCPLYFQWHLGFYKKEYTPTMRGFRTHVGSWGCFVDYYSHEKIMQVTELSYTLWTVLGIGWYTLDTMFLLRACSV